MKYYKGFDKNLKCGDFQYEIGGEYTEENVKLCESGFHACEYPLDVFAYCPPADNRFCEVELDNVSAERGNDSKVCAKHIKVSAEIGIAGIVKASVEYVKSKVPNKPATNTGDWSAATNTGDKSVATNTGDKSVATNMGYQSAATNTGDKSVATNMGYQSAATNTGDKSVATNTGDWSAATNTGDWSAATNTGDKSAATNTGYQSVATNTGVKSAATNTGYQSVATNTGVKSAATNTGDWSVATNTGDQSAATNTGYQSVAEVSGRDSVAIAAGAKSKVRGAIGCAIVCVERGEWNGETYPLLAICSAIVDGEKIKADTWYTVKNGEFVEAE